VTERDSGYEPRSTPASGGGGESKLRASGFWLRTALHPGKRGWGRKQGEGVGVLVTNRAPPRQAGVGAESLTFPGHIFLDAFEEFPRP
jgi:hypothetical protein